MAHHNSQLHLSLYRPLNSHTVFSMVYRLYCVFKLWCVIGVVYFEYGLAAILYFQYRIVSFQYGMSAILWAAWFGHKEAVRLMVNAGANIHSKNRVSDTLCFDFG